MQIQKKSVHPWLRRLILAVLILCVALGVGALCINAYVKGAVDSRICTPDEAAALNDVDCILVLGCGVYDGGIPSPMLADRLEVGCKLYSLHAADKLIMSGDHGQADYDEVNVMKSYAIEQGIESEDIFMDHAGFSTYESIYRAKEIFGADKIVIVTQKYHLYRALYDAEQLGVEAYGVNADPRSYAGQAYRELREILARNKDFFACIFKPKPTFLGEAIPVNGNGDVTNDLSAVQ